MATRDLVGIQTSETGLEATVRYILEVWLAAGLFYRGALHIVFWGAMRQFQGYNEWSPTDVELGLRWGTAVIDDTCDEPMTTANRAAIQAITSVVGGSMIAMHVLSAESVSMPVVTGLIIGPSALVLIGDPFWGAIGEVIHTGDSNE